jgi:hypothetical protein
MSSQMEAQETGGMGRSREDKGCQSEQCQLQNCCPDLPAGKTGTSQLKPALVDLAVDSKLGEENTPLEGCFPLVLVMFKRGPERQCGHTRSKEL